MNFDDVVLDSIQMGGVAYTKDGREFEFNINSEALSDETLGSIFDDLDFRLYEIINDMEKKKTSQCLYVRQIESV
jgi:hypothetical protein